MAAAAALWGMSSLSEAKKDEEGGLVKFFLSARGEWRLTWMWGWKVVNNVDVIFWFSARFVCFGDDDENVLVPAV